MRRLREILLTQYIGAITIGLILAQGIIGLIRVVVEPLDWYVRTGDSQGSVLFSAKAPRPLFPWEGFILGVVDFLLYFVVCYLMVRWLYGNSEDSGVDDPLATPEEVPGE